MNHLVNSRRVAALVTEAVERGRVAESIATVLLQSMSQDEEVAFARVARQELVDIYTRRSQRHPDNAGLRRLEHELVGHEGETILLGSINAEKVVGHMFVDASASSLIGAYLRPL